ncbi:MAG: hypothetical protein NTU41_05255 [Chloroflexi bacterium]|nr:hypothetical protein [Chloroflexota bacterium]
MMVYDTEVARTPQHDCPPHHWMVGSPSDLVCHATCKYCGAEKDFLYTTDSRPNTRPQIVKRQA